MSELRRNGFMRLGIVPWIKQVTDHLDQCPRYPGHIKARPRNGMECNSMEDVMAAPHFLDYAKGFIPKVSEYFDCPAHLWSLNAFYTNKDTPYFPGLHGLHRDRGGSKIVALFIFGTDVPLDSAQLHMRPDDLLEPIYGPRGTAWLADNTHYHCGLIPSLPRTLMWARYADCIPKEVEEEGLPNVA
jgi:hypothetical protein